MNALNFLYFFSFVFCNLFGNKKNKHFFSFTQSFKLNWERASRGVRELCMSTGSSLYPNMVSSSETTQYTLFFSRSSSTHLFIPRPSPRKQEKWKQNYQQNSKDTVHGRHACEKRAGDRKSERRKNEAIGKDWDTFIKRKPKISKQEAAWKHLA